MAAHVPDLQAYRQGRDTYLVFIQDVGPAIRKVINDAADKHLVKAAATVRRHMFGMSYKFQGTVEDDCQESAVPGTLARLLV